VELEVGSAGQERGRGRGPAGIRRIHRGELTIRDQRGDDLVELPVENLGGNELLADLVGVVEAALGIFRNQHGCRSLVIGHLLLHVIYAEGGP
jgi:hypothetical protein